MFLIVLSHYSVFSKADAASMSLGLNKILLDCVGIGKLGVAVFVMISGYFMVKMRFNIHRVVNIILQTLFYSVGTFLLFCIIQKRFSVSGALQSLFPVITGQYWFVTAYVLLFFFMPIINKALFALSRKQFILLLVVLGFFSSFAPTFLDFEAFEYGGHLLYMIMFYCFGAYMRMYPQNILSQKRSLFLIIPCAVLLPLSVISIDFLGTKIGFFAGKEGKFYTVYSILLLLLAVGVLMFFSELKPKHSRVINSLGGCTFGVYLIHENPYMREWIWGDIFNNQAYGESHMLIFHLLMSVTLVFCGCLIIEWVRKNVCEKYIFKPIYQTAYRVSDAMMNKLGLLIDKLIKNGENS